jgi:hypothetical protein
LSRDPFYLQYVGVQLLQKSPGLYDVKEIKEKVKEIKAETL